MDMAQKPPEKVQKIIDANKKLDVLEAFKAAYPNAVIDFKEEQEVIGLEPELDIKAELAKEAEAKAKEAQIEKERKIAEKARLAEEVYLKAQAEYEATLKAINDES